MRYSVFQDNEIQITYEDQQQINCFARNNAKLGDIKDEIEAKQVISLFTVF